MLPEISVQDPARLQSPVNVADNVQSSRRPDRWRKFTIALALSGATVGGGVALDIATNPDVASAVDLVACPNGGDPVPWTWVDTSGDGKMQYGEVGCMDENGNWVWYIAPPTDPYGTEFQINREPSSFHGIKPTRIVDTRSPNSQYPKLGAGKYMDVPVVGGEIPADASSVMVNLTIASANNAGYLSIYPTGTPLPETSSLNPQFAGQDEANTAIVSVGQDGKVRIFSSDGGEVLVDVLGYFKPSDNAESTATSGRLKAQPTERVYDSRGPGEKPLESGVTRDIYVGDKCDPRDFGAVVVNLTAADATGNGFVVVFPGDQSVPDSSNLNFSAGIATANGAIVPMSPEGTIRARATVSLTHKNPTGEVNLIADISACITNDSAPESGNGMYSASAPTRLLDTRGGTKPQPGETRSVKVNDTDDISVGVMAVAGNFTATRVVSPNSGYVTVDGKGTDTNTSLMNVSDADVANGAIVPVDANGNIYLTPTNAEADLIVDISGKFLLVGPEGH